MLLGTLRSLVNGFQQNTSSDVSSPRPRGRHGAVGPERRSLVKAVAGASSMRPVSARFVVSDVAGVKKEKTGVKPKTVPQPHQRSPKSFCYNKSQKTCLIELITLGSKNHREVTPKPRLWNPWILTWVQKTVFCGIVGVWHSEYWRISITMVTDTQ